MKTLVDFAIIGSLILTLWMAGGPGKVKQEKNPPAPPVDAGRFGVNHNEILVKDPGPYKAEHPPIDPQRPIPEDPQSTPRECIWMECGQENLTSLKVDARELSETKTRDSWLTGVWDFLFRGTNPPCEEWGCGSNHNETLAKDGDTATMAHITPPQLPDLEANDLPPLRKLDCDWLECGSEHSQTLKIDTHEIRETKPEGSWLTPIWDLFFRPTNPPPPGGCDDWGCGMNHNEKLTRDQAEGVKK